MNYGEMFKSMIVHPGASLQAAKVAKDILAHKDIYDSIEVVTKVPFWFTGTIHYREADLNFNTYLGNGEPLHHVTRLVPRGRGPFSTFKSGAIDALHLEGFADRENWSIATALSRFEMYNGLGYKKRGLPSPYVWAGTDQYHSGKYVADGVFNPHVVDTQLGCACIVRAIEQTTGLKLE